MKNRQFVLLLLMEKWKMLFIDGGKKLEIMENLYVVGTGGQMGSLLSHCQM